MANGIKKIEFNDEGFRAILSSEECRQLVQQSADEIRDKANDNNSRGGEGFASSVVFGGRAHRYIGFVQTTDKKSMQAESEDGALTRALS